MQLAGVKRGQSRLLLVSEVGCSAAVSATICPIPKLIVLVRRNRAVGMHAEGARALAGLRSGDGPLSIRVRPSSLKHACNRRTTSTGEKCQVNGHARSRLTLETSAGTPAINQGTGGSLPGPDTGHPLHSAGGHVGSPHDPAHTRTEPAARETRQSRPSKLPL